eukprot:6474922-Amphidinium_carterae.1
MSSGGNATSFCHYDYDVPEFPEPPPKAVKMGRNRLPKISKIGDHNTMTKFNKTKKPRLKNTDLKSLHKDNLQRHTYKANQAVVERER